MRTPARLVQAALGSWVLLGVTAIVFNMMQRSLLHRIDASPLTVTVSELRADDSRADALNGAFVGLGLITLVLFIVWFWRAYRNVGILGAPRRYRLGWAIGGWFLPVANLVIPKRIADDINEAVCGRLTLHTGEGGLARVRAWTNAWWVAWIALIVTGMFASSRDRRVGKDVKLALSANTAYTLRAIVIVIAAALALVMVRSVTRAFDRLGDPASSSA